MKASELIRLLHLPKFVIFIHRVSQERDSEPKICIWEGYCGIAKIAHVWIFKGLTDSTEPTHIRLYLKAKILMRDREYRQALR